MKIKQKEFKEYLQEDELLSRKMTYEDFSKVESGVDDSGIEEAYGEIEKFLKTL